MGGALSSFDKDYGFDGKKLEQVFKFSTFGVSMDDAMNLLAISQPDYIKLDVDGIEHLILKGGNGVLRNVKGVLIEINDDFVDQAAGCEAILQGAGLVLKEKRHADIFEGSPQFQHTFNQIWERL